MSWRTQWDKIKKDYPRIRFGIGVVLIIIGLLSLITPLTPGSWLVLIGLELVGIRLVWKNKAKIKQGSDNQIK